MRSRPRSRQHLDVRRVLAAGVRREMPIDDAAGSTCVEAACVPLDEMAVPLGVVHLEAVRGDSHDDVVGPESQLIRGTGSSECVADRRVAEVPELFEHPRRRPEMLTECVTASLGVETPARAHRLPGR